MLTCGQASIGSDIFWYVDAVEEAMCFSRIDSTTKKLDDGTTPTLYAAQ